MAQWSKWEARQFPADSGLFGPTFWVERTRDSVWFGFVRRTRQIIGFTLHEVTSGGVDTKAVAKALNGER